MRLWHYKLIPVLPKNQLLSQWRECCAIAQNIRYHGTPNHLLVNKIMDYPLYQDFYTYCILIISEMECRGYTVTEKSKGMLYKALSEASNEHPFESVGYITQIFQDWHNDEYLIICYYNLKEKYLCGGISLEEWQKIQTFIDNHVLIMNSFFKETTFKGGYTHNGNERL